MAKNPGPSDDDVKLTSNSDLRPEKPADSVQSITRGPHHGKGGQYVALGGGHIVPVDETQTG